MVVACGVGDDAEYLASRGWDVSAFDISATAIEWSRERAPDSVVDYRVADLFALPAEWIREFDLVVEVWTIQSIIPNKTRQAINSIAELVADGGTLLVSTLTSSDVDPGNGPPWPVYPAALDGFTDAGLVVTASAEGSTPYPSVGSLEIEYRRLS
jgi:SAM-dependent methyltransferase